MDTKQVNHLESIRAWPMDLKGEMEVGLAPELPGGSFMCKYRQNPE